MMFKTAWYDFCVRRCLCCYKRGDIDGWVFWWTKRNKYIDNLSDKEIGCYRKFKQKEYSRLKAEVIAAANGKPRHVIVRLNCRKT